MLFLEVDTKMNKEQELLKLAKLRKETRYAGYNCIADYEEGYYECDYVSPYSNSANNVNADVFVILQDWSSDENMQGKCELTKALGYTPTVSTNIKLKALLKKYFSLEFEDTYATNLFPFIKMGGMSNGISIKDMRRSAKQFTLPMIRVVSPKIAIALGSKTFDALYDACDEKQDIKAGSFQFGSTKIFHQPHPAARISNIKKEQGWSEMKEYMFNFDMGTV